jgi:hypothetical protein
MQWKPGMQCLLDNLRLLEAAQGYATLGLYLRANKELEQMSPETRFWPEVLAVKLAIFNGLNLWEMVEIIAAQLVDSAKGNRQWLSVAESAQRHLSAMQKRESLGAKKSGGARASW